ncbi:MAG: O-antigen ligase family protein [Candidatus Gottesmanbacteria bacterium]
MIFNIYLVIKLYFFLGLFLLPLVFWPIAKIPYELPRVWFVQRWIEGFALLTILNLPLLFKNRRIYFSLIILINIFIVWAFISSILGVDFLKSFWGNYYRQDGLFTLIHLASFSFSLSLFWQKSWWKGTAVAISLGVITTSIWAVFWSISHFPIPVSVSFGQANFLAGYLLICLPFLVSLVIKTGKSMLKLFWLAGLCLTIIAIILTFSKGGILGIAFLAVAWLTIYIHQKVTWLNIIPLFLVLIFAFSLLIYSSLKNINAWHTNQSTQYIAESRERIIVKGFLASLQKPLIGWGWTNFDYAFASIDWPAKFNQDVYVDKAHSTFLEILVTTGLVGLIIYLTIVLKVAGRLWQKSKILFLVLVFFLFHTQTNIISIAEELILWLTIGISLSGEIPD